MEDTLLKAVLIAIGVGLVLLVVVIPIILLATAPHLVHH